MAEGCMTSGFRRSSHCDGIRIAVQEETRETQPDAAQLLAPALLS